MPRWRVSACRAAAVLVLCAPLAACERGNEQLDEAALARELRALSSLAAEGAAVASELRAGHLSFSFASAHLGDLADDTDQARSKIARPAPSALEPRQREAQALAGQLLQAFRVTASGLDAPDAQLQRGERVFRQLHDAFDVLAGAR